MIANVIHDRGRGPEIQGTRITVYNLLPHFLDAEATEQFICQLYQLTPEQVAAARAYVLNNTDVLARHLEIELRMAAGNPPEVIEKAKEIHETFVRFREWLAERGKQEVESNRPPDNDEIRTVDTAVAPLTFKQWIAQRELPHAEGS